MITSSALQEGKTTSTVNIAMALARTGQKVLLIDADLRRPMVDKIFADLPDPEAAWRANAEFHPVQRVAEPGEIAAAVLYLASKSSSFVTGSSLVIDGGLTAR